MVFLGDSLVNVTWYSSKYTLTIGSTWPNSPNTKDESFQFNVPIDKLKMSVKGWIAFDRDAHGWFSGPLDEIIIEFITREDKVLLNIKKFRNIEGY